MKARTHWILALILLLTTVAVAQHDDTEKTSTSSNPSIADYGKVVRLPNAVQQPREGSRIVVDVTKGGEADKLNPAIEKVCRFVNIYA